MKTATLTILMLALLFSLLLPAPAALAQHGIPTGLSDTPPGPDSLPPGQDRLPPGLEKLPRGPEDVPPGQWNPPPPEYAEGVRQVTVDESGAQAAAAPVPYPDCQGPLGATRYTGFLPGGAQYVICIPWFIWNRDLVVYAHGYEPKFSTTPSDQLQPGTFKDLYLGGAYVPQVVQLKGYAFAMTNYRDSGLVVVDAQEDLIQVVQKYIEIRGSRPPHIYLVGASEGGIISAKVAENPTRNKVRYFDGVLSACGPIGDFQKETNFLADFRLIWDWAFVQGQNPPSYLYIPTNPALIEPSIVVPDNPPGCSAGAPSTCIDPWNHDYVPAISAAAAAKPQRVVDVLTVLEATYDPSGRTQLYDRVSPYPTVPQVAVGLLWYNAFATNDATHKLGGRPFYNADRTYVGNTSQDFNVATLNAEVVRYANARIDMTAYQTTGKLVIPMLTLHGISDPIQPYFHSTDYYAKVVKARKTSLLAQRTSTSGFGHCMFLSDEVLSAFDSLAKKVTTGKW